MAAHFCTVLLVLLLPVLHALRPVVNVDRNGLILKEITKRLYKFCRDAQELIKKGKGDLQWSQWKTNEMKNIRNTAARPPKDMNTIFFNEYIRIREKVSQFCFNLKWVITMVGKVNGLPDIVVGE